MGGKKPIVEVYDLDESSACSENRLAMREQVVIRIPQGIGIWPDPGCQGKSSGLLDSCEGQ
jgi:hypothetical protein